MRLSRNLPAQHGAPYTISGVVSRNADWIESALLFDADGNQLTGVSADTWQLQLRCSEEDTSAALTLSTTAGTLTVTEGATTSLAIDCPKASMASLDGDYIADLVSKDSVTSDLTHRAHGVISFKTSPISF